MTPPSDPPYELEVARADLSQALKTVARAIGQNPGDACFRFADGLLSIEAANTSADAPALGTWPLPIFVSTWWVRRIARRMPTGDQIRLRADDGRLYMNRYSETCAGTSREQPVSPELSTIDENLLISDAALILKPLRVGRPAVEQLVTEALARGISSWSRGVVAWGEEENKMSMIVERARMKLAPFGVEMTDIRRLVDKMLHDAWKTEREK